MEQGSQLANPCNGKLKRTSEGSLGLLLGERGKVQARQIRKLEGYQVRGWEGELNQGLQVDGLWMY